MLACEGHRSGPSDGMQCSHNPEDFCSTHGKLRPGLHTQEVWFWATFIMWDQILDVTFFFFLKTWFYLSHFLGCLLERAELIYMPPQKSWLVGGLTQGIKSLERPWTFNYFRFSIHNKASISRSESSKWIFGTNTGKNLSFGISLLNCRSGQT